MRALWWGEAIEIENATTKYPWVWAPSYFNRCGSINQSQKLDCSPSVELDE